MNLLLLTNRLDIGGIEMNLVRLTRELTARGHHVTVGGHRGTLSPAIEASGGTSLHLTFRARSPRAVAQDIVALRRAVRTADVVHVFSATSAVLTNVALRLLPRQRRRPVLATIMGIQTSVDEAPWRIWLRARATVLGADILVVTAPAIGRLVARLGVPEVRIRRGSVVGVDVPEPVDVGRRANLRRALGVTADDRVVLTIGRLDPSKSHELFIRAAARVAEARPGVRFVLVGGGTLESELRREIARLGAADTVVMAGERHDATDLLALADVYVRPGVVEGFVGITVLEAQAVAVPVVAFETEDVRAAIDDGVSGFLVPRGDIDELARVIVRLLDDAALARAVGDAGHAQLLRTFALPAVVDDLERWYCEVFEGQSR